MIKSLKVSHYELQSTIQINFRISSINNIINLLQYLIMSEKLIRVYQKLEFENIKSQLLTYGDLAGSCGKCNEMNIKLNMNKCPQCGTGFKYVAFRNVKSHIPKIKKLMCERPSLTIIDYDDFKRGEAENKADNLFK